MPHLFPCKASRIEKLEEVLAMQERAISIINNYFKGENDKAFKNGYKALAESKTFFKYYHRRLKCKKPSSRY